MNKEDKIIEKILKNYTANEIYNLAWRFTHSASTLPATQQRQIAYNNVLWSIDSLGYNAGLLARNIDSWLDYLTNDDYVWKEKLGEDWIYYHNLLNHENKFVISEKDFLNHIWQIAHCDDTEEFWKIIGVKNV